MSKILNTWWAEKYRPKKLEDLVGSEDLLKKVKHWIDTGDIQNLILYSEHSGTSKTTVCRVVANSVDAEVLEINGSDENNVETVREKIKEFATSVTFARWKILIINEFSYFTPNAQSALLDIIERTSHNTRFFLTGNYIEKFLPAIVSRCNPILMQSCPPKDISNNLKRILTAENIEFDEVDVAKVIRDCYPDQRKMLNFLQLNSIGGKFTYNEKSIVANDYCGKITTELKGSNNAKVKFDNIRQIIADAKVRQFDDLFRYLYEKLHEYAPDGKKALCIAAIADGQYKSNFVVDKEIQVMNMVINLLNEIK